MKNIFLAIVSFTMFSCANANNNTIFGAKITLQDSCKISVSNQDKQVIFKPKFDLPGECRLVTHDGTNIVHVKFVNGAYVFFVENNYIAESGCSSEYTAMGLSKDMTFYTTEMVKNSRSCNRDQEVGSFEYFSAMLKPYTQKALTKMLN